jgi:site-specific DNA-methyltransferase (adenine-specific)/modification methylase
MERFINQVIEGDCLKVMVDFPEKSIDLILCDLPYGITHNVWDQPIDLTLLWQQYIRIIKPDGVIILSGSGVFTGQLIMSNPTMFKYKIVWIKSKATNFLNVKKQPLRKHEDFCIFYNHISCFVPQMIQGLPYNRGQRLGLTDTYNVYKSAPILNLTGLRYPSDVLFFEEPDIRDFIYVPAENKGKSGFHSTQKPIQLGRYLVRTYSKKDAIVLDNACGSGSFLVAAVLENRRFIGIEKNQAWILQKARARDFIQISRERLKEAFQQRELFRS